MAAWVVVCYCKIQPYCCSFQNCFDWSNRYCKIGNIGFICHSGADILHAVAFFWTAGVSQGVCEC